MKILHNLLFIFLIIIYLSCENKETGHLKDTQTGKDTILTEKTPLPTANTLEKRQMDSNLLRIISKFQDTTFAPFGKISEGVLEQTKKGIELHTEEVRLLTQYVAAHWSLDFPKFYLKKFYEIDSAKQINQYKNWLQNNNSEGNIIQTTIYANQKMNFYGETDLLFWTLHHRTAEACPFAEGQVIFATIVHEGQLGDTFILASRLSAGDAPISSETTVQTLLLGDASMKLAYHQEVHEDNTLIKKERKVCKMSIKDGKVRFEK